MNSQGTITEAKRDESDEGTVTLEGRGSFQRWLVTIDADGKTVKTSVLRKPESPSPEGKQAELVNGRWKLSPPLPGGGSRGHSPAQQKTITRQGAQQRAALYLIAKALCKQHGVDLDIDEFTRLVGVFERDATGEQV